MVWQAVESVLTLLILICVGWWLAGQPWFGKTGGALFSKYVVQIAVPCYMFYNMTDVCGSREELLTLFRRVPLPTVVILFSFFVALALSKLLKVQRERLGVFLNVITFSNVVFVGFPVISAIFGEQGMPYAMIYYLANTLFFWTGGICCLRRYGNGAQATTAKEALKGIFSPPIVGMLIGVVFVFFDLSLPKFLLTPVSMLKSTATPIAMLFIGSVIRNSDIKRMRLSMDLVAVVLMRFLVLPALVGLLVALLPL